MYKNYKIICSIAARAGSKGVPGKNTKLLGGIPLISYAIQAAKKSSYIDRTIVSTEDKKIAKISKQYGAEIPYFRQNNLTEDLTPLTAVTKDTMEKMDVLGYHANIIIQFSPTCPFITSRINNVFPHWDMFV